MFNTKSIAGQYKKIAPKYFQMWKKNVRVDLPYILNVVFCHLESLC